MAKKDYTKIKNHMAMENNGKLIAFECPSCFSRIKKTFKKIKGCEKHGFYEVKTEDGFIQVFKMSHRATWNNPLYLKLLK